MSHIEVVRRQAGLTAELDTNPDYEGWSVKHYVKLVTFSTGFEDKAESVYAQILNEHDRDEIVMIEDRIPHFFKDSENVKLLVFYKVVSPNAPLEQQDDLKSIQDELKE